MKPKSLNVFSFEFTLKLYVWLNNLFYVRSLVAFDKIICIISLNEVDEIYLKIVVRCRCFRGVNHRNIIGNNN